MSRSLAIAIASALFATIAATPARAINLGFWGTLSLEIATLAPIVIHGGATAVVNGSGGGGPVTSLQVGPGGFVTTARVVTFTDPGNPFDGVRLTLQNGAGQLLPSGVMPLAGVAKVCLFGPCPSALANLTVPLSVIGAGGSQFLTGVSANVTVQGAPWTTGTAVIGAFTAMGYRDVQPGPTSGTSTTIQGGSMQFVTPVFISTNGGSDAVIPAFAVLTLHFAPEPGTLLLLASGLAALGAAGRRRMRARR